MKSLTFIKTHGVDALTEHYNIKVKRHHSDGRIILNYDQINSPKENEIVGECRALTVTECGDLIARSLPRFFNAGEAPSITSKFIWDRPFKAWEKVDGSLAVFHYYQDDWRLQTRHSFGDHPITGFECYEGDLPKSELNSPTWKEVFEEGLRKTDFYKVEKCYRNITFICELCSPYNRVVRKHEETSIYLLTTYTGSHELDDNFTDNLAKSLKIARPQKYDFQHWMDVQNFIQEEGEKDNSFEGVVLKDIKGMRLKVKSAEYVRLSHMLCNGNIFLPRYLIPIILNGELDEVSSYFPEVKEKAAVFQAKINKARKEIDNYWFCFSDEKSKRKFYESVKDSKFCGILCSAYDKKQRTGEGHWEDYWDVDFILRNIFK